MVFLCAACVRWLGYMVVCVQIQADGFNHKKCALRANAIVALFFSQVESVELDAV